MSSVRRTRDSGKTVFSKKASGNFKKEIRRTLLAGSALVGVAFTASQANAITIGHFGDPDVANGITAGGQTPVALTNLTAGDLSGLDALWILNPSNSGYSGIVNLNLGAISGFVNSGGYLIFHDRRVTEAASILPGAGGILFSRAPVRDINFSLLGTTITNGPGGVLTDLSLDGYGFSSHGFALNTSLPGGSTIVSTRTNASEVNDFFYSFGSGTVYYSTSPLDAFNGFSASWQTYQTNLAAFVGENAGCANTFPSLSCAITETATSNGFFGAGTITFDNAGAIMAVQNGVIIPNDITFNTGGEIQTILGGVELAGVSGNINLISNTLTVNPFDAGDVLTLSGVLSGTGSLSKVGAGTLVLSGANTFSGGTTLNGGTIRLLNSSGLGTGDLLALGSTLELGNGVNNPVNINMSADFTLATVVGGNVTAEQSGNINTSFDLSPHVLSLTARAITDTLSVSGVISGSGSLLINGDGTVNLSGANTFTGGATITGGTLNVLSGSSITGTVVDGIAGLNILTSVEINNISGTITGGLNGIILTNTAGPITISNTGTGHIEGQNGDGIKLQFNTGDINIFNDGGAITGAETGIDIDIFNGGSVLISNNGGTITGGAFGAAVDILEFTDFIDSDVTIDNAGGVMIGASGIKALNDGFFVLSNTSGIVSGNTAFGVYLDDIGSNVTINNNNGSITATGLGLLVFIADGHLDVNNQGGSISGGVDGIEAAGVASGITITNNTTATTNPATISGGTGDGINLISNTGNINIFNDGGNIIGGATGIDIDNVNLGDVLISNNGGTISGGFDGINIVAVATGNVTIDNDGGAITGTGGRVIFINQGDIGNIDISNQGGSITNSGIWEAISILNVGGADVDIDNRFGGVIDGASNGITVIGIGGDATILNDFGSIIGNNLDGIRLSSIGDTLADNVVISNNNGSIVGGNAGFIFGRSSGIDIDNVAGSVLIDNDDGSISGLGDHGVDVGDVDGSLTISNVGGSISGAINGIIAFDVLGGISITNNTTSLATMATISGGTGDGIRLLGNTGNINIFNDGGNIIGGATGIDIDGVNMGDVLITNNDGTISGGAAGVGINVNDVTGSDVTVDNAGGMITGGTGIFVSDIDGVFRLDNTSGTVDGTVMQGVNFNLINQVTTTPAAATGVDINNNNGTIQGVNQGILGSNVVGTVNISNFDGVISNTGTSGQAVLIRNADSLVITNSGGLIDGGGMGIFATRIGGTNTTLTNISITNIDLSNTNPATISGGRLGISLVNNNGNISIDNRGGLISVTGIGTGIKIDDGSAGGVGDISINNAGGSIVANGKALWIDSQDGSVMINNAGGLITTTGAAIGTGILFNNGTGNIDIINTSSGTISGRSRGIRSFSQNGTLTINNSGGLISGFFPGTSPFGTGVRLSGGSGGVFVTNTASGTISGGTDGINTNGQNGSITVNNAGGKITGMGDDGIDLLNITGVVGIVNVSGTISGGDNGIEVFNVGDLTINNFFGTLTGGDDGINASMVTGSVLIVNDVGSISGGDDGIDLASVSFSVEILNVGGTIAGGDNGIEVFDVGAVRVNNFFGTISGGTGDGILLVNNTGDINISNNGGVISGGLDGIRVVNQDGSLTVNNAGGNITGTAQTGIDLDSGTGTVLITNTATGTISGGIYGIHLVNQSGSLTVNNAAGNINGTSQDGIRVDSGSGVVTVTNVSGGSITGGNSGIQVFTHSGSVMVSNNAGFISGSSGLGIFVFFGTGNATITNNSSGTITGGQKGVGLFNQTGSLDITNNGGLINGTANSGVMVASGTGSATINNANGIITGGQRGVGLRNQIGSLSINNDSGLISGATVAGVSVSGGVGSVSITGNSGGIITGGNDGIRLNSVNGSISISNAGGDITGTAQTGIDLDSGTGTVLITNGSGGSITGGQDGININSQNGTITVNNDGGSITGTADDGIDLNNITGPVNVSNVGGTISGRDKGIEAFNVSGNVAVNNTSGVVSAASDIGIWAVNGGGNVAVNNNSGSILGGLRGISVTNPAGNVTINNLSGTIAGTGSAGFFSFGAGGNVVVNNNNGSITGGRYGVAARSVSGNFTVNNTSGFVSGVSVFGVAVVTVGGNVTVNNNSGTITSGGKGIYVDDVNGGDVFITNTGGSITGGAAGAGVDVFDVTGSDVTIDNTGGTITGGTGIAVSSIDGVFTLNNLNGVVSGTAGNGLDLNLINQGSTPATTGVDINNTSGAITGFTDGIEATNITGSIDINNTGGSIVGGNDGIEIFDVGALSIDNAFGTISGGDNGITASSVAGDVIIGNTSGLILGGSGEGIDISDVGGNVAVTNNGGLIAGTAGIYATGISGNFRLTNVSGTILGTSSFNGLSLEDIGGSVAINNNNGTISGDDDGIGASTIVGPVLISNTGGTISGPDAGINLSGIGGAVTINNGTGGSITGATFGVFLNDGFSLQIDNDGLIQGLGTFSSPTIWSEAPSGTVINNTSLGVIQGATGSPEEVIIRTFGGGTTINNGGAMTGRVFTDDGNDSLTNSGLWTVFSSNDFAGQSSGSDVINNSGIVITAVNSGSLEVTSFLDLEIWNNGGGLLTMLDGAEGDSTSMPAAFNGGAGSQLGLDTFLGAPGSISDVLNIGSSPGGVTAIVINNTNPGFGAANPNGIVIVNGSTNAGAFTLSPSSSGFLNGVLQKGLWDYKLVFDGSQHLLVGEPGQVAHQLPVTATAAQALFAETAGLWRDRTADLRYDAKDGLANGKPGAWMSVFGNWGDRDISSTPVSPLVTTIYNTSYGQDMSGLMMGLDVAKDDIGGASDTLIVGVMGGIGQTKVEFDALGTTVFMDGGTIGGYLTYLHQEFFVDAVVKYDFMSMDLSAPGIVGFNGSREVDVSTFGVIVDAGYRHEVQNTGMFIEPLVSVIYAKTKIDDFSILGTTVDFDDNSSLKGSLGMRFGAVLDQSANYVVDFSIDGRVWHEFQGDNTVVFRSAGPATSLLDDFGGSYTEVSGIINYLDLNSGFSFFLKGGVKFDKTYQSNTIRAGIRVKF